MDISQWSLGDLFGPGKLSFAGSGDGRAPNFAQWSTNDLFGTGKAPPAFGVEHRDPLQETRDRMGFNTNSNDYGQFRQDLAGGTDDPFLRNTIMNGDILNLPMIQDFMRRENFMNPIRGSAGKTNDFLQQMMGVIGQRAKDGADPGVKNRLAASTRAGYGQELKDAISAGRGSFDPTLGSNVLADSEANTRMQFGAELGKTLSQQEIDFEKLKSVYAGMVPGVAGASTANNTLLAGLEPGQIGTGLTALNAGLTETDINNSRFEETAAKGDFNNLINWLTGRVDQATNIAMSIPSLFGIGGGGGGGSSGGSSDAMGWFSSIFGPTMGLGGSLGAASILA